MAPMVVLITGCSSGMGLAEAVYLATTSKHDFKVYATVIDLDQREHLERAAGDSLNKKLFIRKLDVTKEDTITSVVDEIVRENKKLDVVVNNAGILDQIGFFFNKTRSSVDDARAMMEVNVLGPARVIHAVLPTMKKQKFGRIINTTSGTGIEATPFLEFYSASKFALEGLSESLAPVLRKGYNIRVSILEPSAVLTPLLEKAMNPDFKPDYVCGTWEEEAQELYKNYWEKDLKSALGVYIQPEEVAQILEEIILCDDPHLRYQTNATLKKTVAAKMVDPTGDSVFKVFQAFQ
ncbi:retinol dehydrogenase 8-like [Acanthaster planci]|uniref:Retinol dehydrogenase 8-like n=1 Tax=Acanthaster planci TaxID=133434 RepID=A0A8B7XM34_ACAPL|nr:retinol dehydrogenase 8-like [Acanthaster planci]